MHSEQGSFKHPDNWATETCRRRTDVSLTTVTQGGMIRRVMSVALSVKAPQKRGRIEARWSDSNTWEARAGGLSQVRGQPAL